jgi:hypothetical protein
MPIFCSIKSRCGFKQPLGGTRQQTSAVVSPGTIVGREMHVRKNQKRLMRSSPLSPFSVLMCCRRLLTIPEPTQQQQSVSDAEAKKREKGPWIDRRRFGFALLGHSWVPTGPDDDVKGDSSTLLLLHLT